LLLLLLLPLLLLLHPQQALELGYWLRQQYIDTHGFLPASRKPGQQF
jgi:hypothetical protein